MRTENENKYGSGIQAKLPCLLASSAKLLRLFGVSAAPKADGVGASKRGAPAAKSTPLAARRRIKIKLVSWSEE
ncbi:MAG: hypothetical protein ABSF38_04460 [Verrucomicrobiota bacterium]|jgi:hypothetical protein